MFCMTNAGAFCVGVFVCGWRYCWVALPAPRRGQNRHPTQLALPNARRNAISHRICSLLSVEQGQFIIIVLVSVMAVQVAF
jgi:hypothetical protein